MKYAFTKENTNILKGVAILLIVCHHVFWDCFFSNGREQIFFLPDLTEFFTRWGFCCNHVFSAITGYGIAASERKKSSIKFFFYREISLLSVFVPIYIMVSVVYIMGGGVVAYYNIYFQGNHWKAVLNLMLDMLGYADAFKMSLLNPTWWYFSAVHVTTIVITFCSVFFWKKFRKLGYIFVWAFLFMLMVTKPILYGSMVLSALSGYLIFQYDIVRRLSLLFENRQTKNKATGHIIKILALCLWIIGWYGLVQRFDAHLVSAVMLPLPSMLLTTGFLQYIPGINKGLAFVGKYSAYIFMIHTLIYSVYPLASDFVFSFEYAVITYFLVVGISLTIGIIFDKVERTIGYKKIIEWVKEKLE